MIKETVDRKALVLTYDLQESRGRTFACRIKRVLAVGLGPTGNQQLAVIVGDRDGRRY